MDRQEYEYKVIDMKPGIGPEQIETNLTAMGICGWQLVIVQGDCYVFERPR